MKKELDKLVDVSALYFFQCLDSCLLNKIKWRQSCSGWVEIFQFSVGWVGLDQVT